MEFWKKCGIDLVFVNFSLNMSYSISVIQDTFLNLLSDETNMESGFHITIPSSNLYILLKAEQ